MTPNAPFPPPPDLLAHKYRPHSVEALDCHREQAKRLKQWILDFTNAPRNDGSQSSDDSDYNDFDAMSDDSNAEPKVARRCVLLTGPPGVGKTSLVYTVASELKMHIVESHSSERRDFKLFKTLKLANQKGKINPIARLFQMTQQKTTSTTNRHPEQQQQQRQQQPPPPSKGPLKRKRRTPNKLAPTAIAQQSNGAEPKNPCLTLSGTSSIVLFDDIDVVFDDDGPFLKSLAEFIRDSKRPVVLTATRSIEQIKSTLVHFEHIQLDKPQLNDCVTFLKNVCDLEKYQQVDEPYAKCQILAKKMNGDIRQCLNRIHFYGSQASTKIEDDTCDYANVTPDISRLGQFLGLKLSKTLLEKTTTTTTTATATSRDDPQQPKDYQEPEDFDDDKTDIVGEGEDDDEKTIILNLEEEEADLELNEATTNHELPRSTLECYDTSLLIDLMDSKLNILDKRTLLTRWLDGKPSHRPEGHGFEHELGEQIRESIVELTQALYTDDLLASDKLRQLRDEAREKGEQGQSLLGGEGDAAAIFTSTPAKTGGRYELRTRSAKKRRGDDYDDLETEAPDIFQD